LVTLKKRMAAMSPREERKQEKLLIPCRKVYAIEIV
jgi:hypothetical protein